MIVDFERPPESVIAKSRTIRTNHPSTVGFVRPRNANAIVPHEGDQAAEARREPVSLSMIPRALHPVVEVQAGASSIRVPRQMSPLSAPPILCKMMPIPSTTSIPVVAVVAGVIDRHPNRNRRMT